MITLHVGTVDKLSMIFRMYLHIHISKCLTDLNVKQLSLENDKDSGDKILLFSIK